MPTVEEFKQNLLASPPEDFVSNYIYETIPAVFASRNDYNNWRVQFARSIGVDPFSVLIVGSCALHFSLNPKKAFRPFGEHSDIDVAVVSTPYFEIAGQRLRELQITRHSLSEPVKKSLKNHRNDLVFACTIATDTFLGHFEFGTRWLEVLHRESNSDIFSGRPVKIRLYRDSHALFQYQTSSISSAQALATA